METDKPEPKIALVTGGARRIGAQIARSLHAAGWQVWIHCRGSVAEAERLQYDLNRSRPDSARVLQADLLNVDEVKAMVGQMSDATQKLHLLVNNASTFYPTPIETATTGQWDDLFGSNLKAPFFLTQAALPMLRQAGGCIVNIVDIHAQRPMPKHPVYSAAKAGLLALTRALAVDLAPEVRVNAVAPGAILWPESPQNIEAHQAVLSRVPMQRMGSPQDIARTVLFLAQDAPYVTGQVIAVDGGRSALI